jgi:hypothetical protein
VKLMKSLVRRHCDKVRRYYVYVQRTLFDSHRGSPIYKHSYPRVNQILQRHQDLYRRSGCQSTAAAHRWTRRPHEHYSLCLSLTWYAVADWSEKQRDGGLVLEPNAAERHQRQNNRPPAEQEKRVSQWPCCMVPWGRALQRYIS